VDAPRQAGCREPKHLHVGKCKGWRRDVLPHVVMSLDYSRFERVEVSSSSGSDEDGVGTAVSSLLPESRVSSEQGLFRAFVAIHERRLEVDRWASMLGGRGVDRNLATADRDGEDAGAPTHDAGDIASIVDAYDDICERLLALDGVRCEARLRASGHRFEVVKALLGGTRASMLARDWDAAEMRASRAVDAMRIPHAEGADTQQVHVDAAEVYLCRSKALLQRGSYEAARQDALMANSLARQCGDDARTETSGELALRCEMALHAGGPGLSGEGRRLSPDDVDTLQIGSYTYDLQAACDEDADFRGALLSDLNKMD